MNKTLTPTQRLVLDYIKDYIKQNGYAPTIREVAKGLNFVSSSSVHRYLAVLKDKGYITYNEGQARTIKVI